MPDPAVELIMSEFGSGRRNAGGAQLAVGDRLNPTLDSFRRIYPHAAVTVYTDQPAEFGEGIDIVRVDPPFDSSQERYGWRAHDYYQAHGLLQSKADVAIAMDSDMIIVSDEFRAIAEFAAIFGLAIPVNPRLLLKIDGGIGADSTYKPASDRTRGTGLTFNLTPLAFATSHAPARALLRRYCELLLARPGRGAVHLVQASYESGYQPYVLPPQWCVCSPRDLDSKHLWLNAIALHVGHRDVLPRWKREIGLAKWRSRLAGLKGWR